MQIRTSSIIGAAGNPVKDAKMKILEDYSKAFGESIHRRWWVYVIFFIAFFIVARTWLVQSPPWKSVIFLLTLVVTFFFLMSTKSRSLAVRYCRISMILFMISFFISFSAFLATSGPARETDAFNLSSLVGLNLQLSVFIMILKDIIIARAINLITHKRWVQIAASIIVLFIYVSWFATIYSSPNMDGIESSIGENFDRVNGMES